MTVFDAKDRHESEPLTAGRAANATYAPAALVLAQATEVPMLTPTMIWIIVGVIAALILLYAILRAARRPSKPEITPRREPTPEDRVPTKDVLEDRMEVEGPVEITDDMSLAEIKRAKAARVTSKSKAVRRETSKEATERARREREEAEKATKEAREAAESSVAPAPSVDAGDAEEGDSQADVAATPAGEAASEASDAQTPPQDAADAARQAAQDAARKIEAAVKDEAEARAEEQSEAQPDPSDAPVVERKIQLKKPEFKAPPADAEHSERKEKPAFHLPKPKAVSDAAPPVEKPIAVPRPETKVETKPEAKAEAPDKPEIAPKPAKPAQPADIKAETKPAKTAPASQAKSAPTKPAPEAAPKSLAQGLAKTRTGFIGRLSGLFSGEHLAEDMVEEVEEILFTADIGPRVARDILAAVENGLSGEEKQDPARIWGFIREFSADLLKSHEKPLRIEDHKPFVMLVVGVNGAGKTTTIGKLASKYRAQGKSVLLVAGDTFRAGAVDQLAVWADRSGFPIHEGAAEADPSSVLFAGIERGIKEDVDVIICDTSGRLQTNVNLMDELAKMARVAGKALDGAPHETMLVLDANTGQNAIVQAKKFNEAVHITGIALTKLDGTARGGVILGICDELDAPVRYIGIGESVEDLRTFEADEFVDALFM